MRRLASRPLQAAFFLILLVPAAWLAAGDEPPSPEFKPVGTPVVTVASLNIAMETDANKIAAELNGVKALVDADLIFFQEVVREDGSNVAEQVAEKMNRVVVFTSPDEGIGTKGGVAILSRRPIDEVQTVKLKAENLVFRSRKRVALAGTVDSPVGRLRAINTHLDTRINPGERLKQLQPALKDAEAFEGPAVIGGDFNTNDMQWVSNVVPVPFPGWQASRVRTLMESRGFYTPFQVRRATFDHLGMQLDWIYSKTLKPVSSGVIPIEFSDHHAIWAQFRR